MLEEQTENLLFVFLDFDKSYDDEATRFLVHEITEQVIHNNITSIILRNKPYGETFDDEKAFKDATKLYNVSLNKEMATYSGLLADIVDTIQADHKHVKIKLSLTDNDDFVDRDTLDLAVAGNGSAKVLKAFKLHI